MADKNIKVQFAEIDDDSYSMDQIESVKVKRGEEEKGGDVRLVDKQKGRISGQEVRRVRQYNPKLIDDFDMKEFLKKLP